MGIPRDASRFLCSGRSVLVAAAALAALPLTLTPALAQEKAMIVLDGSGSMWGRIGDTPKIVIAKDVLTDVLSSSPENLDIGLMSYGHREKGNCQDIEILMPPGPGTTPAIAGLAEGISPRGKTPLSDAVRIAAETLRYGEERATVILITDGLETCNADPCALGLELERSGLNFTTHVVGFGLSPEEGRQVACLAEATGGRYFPASDARSLGEALSDTMIDVVEFAEPEPAAQEAEPEPIELPTADLIAAATVEIGARFDVGWEGPGDRHDRIDLFNEDANSGDGVTVVSRRIHNGDVDNRSVQLVAPVRPGHYLLRYQFEKARHVIATLPIEVVEAPVWLDAPATVDLGLDFTVTWEGPGGRKDAIEIIDPRAADGAGRPMRGKRVVNDDFENKKVTLVAPAEPGFYQLRYWNGDNNETIATREIEVLDAVVTINAPAVVDMGTSFPATWVGPGGRRDTIQIVEPSAGDGRAKPAYERRLANDDFEGRTVTLVAPAQPGEYLLRYWNGVNRKVLATRTITVREMSVGITAPDTVLIAHMVKAQWAGPGGRRDAVQLIDPAGKGGRGSVLISKRLITSDYENRSVEFPAPAIPGTYELRYWNGDSKAILATRQLIVENMHVSLGAPSSVAGGSRFTVTWEGPGAIRDAVEVYDPNFGAGRGKVIAAKRLSNGDYAGKSVEVVAPEQAGNYVLRYWNGDSKVVLAEQPLVVQ